MLGMLTSNLVQVRELAIYICKSAHGAAHVHSPGEAGGCEPSIDSDSAST